jgi:hypothetical protein
MEAKRNKAQETARRNLEEAKVHLGAGPWTCGCGHYLGPTYLKFAERANTKKMQDTEARDKSQVEAHKNIVNEVKAIRSDKNILPGA